MNTRDYLDFDNEEFQATPSRGATANSKRTVKQTSTGRKSFKRRGKSPQQFNGIHRRRSKSIRW